MELEHKERIGETMATRKQHFDDNDDQTDQATKRTRITIDVTPELRRRIKMAAFKNDQSISEYLGSILGQVIPDYESTTQQRHPVTRKTLNDILQVREEIMRERKGEPFSDSVEIIHQMREERTKELEQL
jgi:hypothetical protein